MFGRAQVVVVPMFIVMFAAIAASKPDAPQAEPSSASPPIPVGQPGRQPEAGVPLAWSSRRRCRGLWASAPIALGTFAPQTFTMILLSGFASITLLLTGIGVDGTVSYAVAQQVREFGTRIAPGGQRAHVMRIVLLRSMTVTTNGMALGYGGALTQVLRGHWRILFH